MSRKSKPKKLRKDSGYTSHGIFPPNFSFLQDDKTAKKRFIVLEVHEYEVEKKLFSFNTKMKQRFDSKESSDYSDTERI